MTTGAPFIGSKISLISNAEIRYEGILYQVDTKESTVTLAKVRSFGTEDRPSAKLIPPRSEVYEFIIFRGSDIKDLNVSEMPEEPSSPPQDPAILSTRSTAPVPISSVAPATVVSTSQPPPTVPQQPPPAPYNTHPQYFPHPQAMGGYSPFGMPYFRPPVMMGAGPHPMQPGVVPSRPQAPAESATNQGIPPTSFVPPHVSVIGAPPAQSHTPPRPLPNSTADPSSNLVATPTYAPASTEVKPQASSTPVVSIAETSQPSQPVQAQPLPPAPVTAPAAHPPAQPEPHPSSQPPPEPVSTERREKGEERHRQQGQARGEFRNDYRGGEAHRGDRGGRGYSRGRRGGHYNSRGGGGGGRGGGGYNYRQSNRGGYGGRHPREGGGYGRRNQPHEGQQPAASSASAESAAPIKYDKEFDFETANARFSKDSLEQEFKEKLRLDSGSRKPSEGFGEGVADGESPPEDDEVLVVEEEEGPADEPEVEDYYDKSKSFFDNISCEASSNKKYSRNEEREVNMQTFGVSSVNRGYGYRRRGRGRGRGGYRGRGRYGGGGGGGGWGNRRGGGGYSNNRDYYQRPTHTQSHEREA